MARIRTATPPGWPGRAAIATTAALVVVLDAVTGPAVHFPILAVIPVVAAAWFGFDLLAAFLVAGMPATRAVLEWVWWHSEPSLGILTVNAGIRILVLALVGVLAAAAGRNARRLGRELETLRGILPICSHCKRIRDEAGTWQPLERYIGDRTEAAFSHGLCTDCLHEHYGQLFDPPRQGPPGRR